MMLHPSMSDHPGLNHLSFDGMGLYEQPRPRVIFKMPRVVPDQKSKFESDDLFRRLSRESEVKYTGHRERMPEERQGKFLEGCRTGRTDIAFTATGTNLQLQFGICSGNYSGDPCDCDFNKEQGKVHIKSHLIMNGVCVMWRGWIDLERLDGVGCLEFDETRAAEEDRMLREQVELWKVRGTAEMEDKQRYRMAPGQHHPHHPHHPQAAATHLNYHHHLHAAAAAAALQQQQQQPGPVDANLVPNHHQDPDMEIRLRAY